jgi:hypothetical protein
MTATPAQDRLYLVNFVLYTSGFYDNIIGLALKEFEQTL